MRRHLAFAWILSFALLFGGATAYAQADEPEAPAEDAPSEDEGEDAEDDDEIAAEWTEEDEAWAEGEGEDWGEETEAPQDEDEAGPAPEEPEPAEEPETPDQADDTSVGEDDEAVEGQEGGLGDARDPVLYRPAPSVAGDDDFSLIVPPILYERAGGIESIAVFPLFYLRQGEGTTELTIPPYYLMRGEREWDVLFPIFWWLRGEGHHTWAIPPLWHHESTDGYDFGFFPFVMTGRHDARFYTVIPPLLTLDWGIDDEERFTFSSLFWRVWEGGTEHWGIFPFLWVENAETSSYTLAPPLFFRFEDRDEGTALTVVPPFYHRDEPNGSYFGIPPLFHHNSGEGHTSTTIFPLLSHYSQEPDVFRLTVAGLFWWWQDHGDETIVTPLYQRFRGATELDAITPLFFHIRDPRTDSTTLIIPPLLTGHIEDPTSVATVVFPFFARFEERGRSTTWLTPLFGQHTDYEAGDETTWVLPTIQVSQWHDGDAVNIHPIWYYESVPDHRYTVLAPIFWDFEEFTGDQNRYTVVFPFFWRFREGNTTSTLVFNTYHRERTRQDGSSEWEFHFVPFFSYGEYSSGGHWWKVFYGLFGYERRGPYGVTTLFYVPFQTDGPALPNED